LRVLCLGDSRTFGIWTDLGKFRYDNDWPRYLAAEALETAGERPIEAWNSGTLGYTTAHGLRLWQTRLRDLDADVVVVAFGFNDHLLVWNKRYRVHDPTSALARKLLFAAGRSRVVELLWWQVRRPPFSEAHLEAEAWVSLAEHRRNLERFAEEARRRGMKLVFLDLPLRDLSRGENLPAFDENQQTPVALFGAQDLAHLHQLYAERRAVLREVASREEVPVVDVEAAFARHVAEHPDEEMFGSYDSVHPTAAGARVIAGAVVDELRELHVYP
jgi:lysophospholipase L1-like esterase